MQTFITSLDLRKSAAVLWEGGRPHNRLNNQINEALIILRTLTGWYEERGKKGWPNHPATRLWDGHEVLLEKYLTAHIQVYEELSGKNQADRRIQVVESLGYDDIYLSWLVDDIVYPSWLTEEFCSNHRAVLKGKAWDAWWDVMATFSSQDMKSVATEAKAWSLIEWYQSQGWTETPAVRNEDSKWPYLWAVTV